ncbi:hypothetical protein CPJCM30710_29540 [Clostridium polyendosporum]|uniref:Uncharacterized protein n=1 Tax=Clostridium polyendosporum TaxID=69208 RepID=A0A919VN73_9CLOT|nr:hypothetical protein [Clostridium polyendosporum]GIM30288.1 hypothetical protein CPJCM30710_29540 [Clostridium polyendosporum]
MKRNIKVVAIVILITVTLFSYLFISGYRVTALGAIKAQFDLGQDLKVFEEVERDWATVYLLETPDGIKTALASKEGVLWRCSSITYFFDEIIKNDDIKTVG